MASAPRRLKGTMRSLARLPNTFTSRSGKFTQERRSPEASETRAPQENKNSRSAASRICAAVCSRGAPSASVGP